MPRTKLHDPRPVETLSILDEHGRVDEALDPGLDPETLRRIHRAMVLTRQLDIRMLRMQRQGQMGTFAPGRGQEATQIGSVFHLRPDDWYYPSYRSFGAQLWRGWTVDGLMLLWDGYFQGFTMPEGVNELPFSIVIGAHLPPAVGVGMGIRIRGRDQVVLTNFGDGASSEGDFHEAANFAGVFEAPVIFLCENNQWAISTPFARQTRAPSVAQRAIAYGIHGLQVDGNDVLAVLVAHREAIQRARAGEGPTLIEALTYRMDVHTTADDPTVYRDTDDVTPWEVKDPIARFERYLKDRGTLTDADLETVRAETEAQVQAGREAFDRIKQKNHGEVFNFVFETLPPELAAQKQEYLAKLARQNLT
jgi:pyruvate dehydrogenase E1 component subunit alpha